jgi:tetratricopeptide (TPR) repeat protein
MVIGRDQELEELARTMAGGRGAALIGMGGVGKTTLAQEYVRAHAREYSWVWWFDASSAGTLTSGLAEEGRTAMSASGAVNVSSVVDADAEAHARRLLRNSTGWLVVLDSAAGVAEVRDTMTAALAGTFLVTTREDQDWQDLGVAPIDIHPLSKDDAVGLLTARARPSSMEGWDSTGDAGDLVEALGCLPLAVTQVGALLHLDGADDPSDMLAQWQNNPEAHLDPAAPGTLSERTMAHTWDLSITRLEESEPSAVQLLSILGWLGPPEAIPKSLLNVLPVDAFADGPSRALRAAASASLLTMRADTIAVHPVLHLVLRTADDTLSQRAQDRVDEARATVAAMLRQIIGESDPSDPTAWPTIRSLVESVELLATRSATGQEADASYVAKKVGAFLSGQGSHDRAVSLLKWDFKRADQVHSAYDSDILTAHNNLAGALRGRRGPGDLDTAISMYQTALTRLERVQSTDHPDTLATRNNLAQALIHRHKPGDLDRAIGIYQTVLTNTELVLGIDHPASLTIRNNLAGALSDRHGPGDLDTAINLYQTVLADQERVLGADHPRTLATCNNLALALTYRHERGDLDRAIDLHRKVLTDSERVLDADHPDTLTIRNNLAGALSDRHGPGDLDTAITLFQSVLTDEERVLGTDHPSTLATRHNLAHALKQRRRQ